MDMRIVGKTKLFRAPVGLDEMNDFIKDKDDVNVYFLSDEIISVSNGNTKLSVDLKLGGYWYTLERPTRLSGEGLAQLEKLPGVKVVRQAKR